MNVSRRVNNKSLQNSLELDSIFDPRHVAGEGGKKSEFQTEETIQNDLIKTMDSRNATYSKDQEKKNRSQSDSNLSVVKPLHLDHLKHTEREISLEILHLKAELEMLFSVNSNIQKMSSNTSLEINIHIISLWFTVSSYCFVLKCSPVKV